MEYIFVEVLSLNREDRIWGIQDEVHGNFSGMVGSIHKGEADLIAASLSYTKDRIEAVDYLLQVDTETRFVWLVL